MGPRGIVGASGDLKEGGYMWFQRSFKGTDRIKSVTGSCGGLQRVSEGFRGFQDLHGSMSEGFIELN